MWARRPGNRLYSLQLCDAVRRYIQLSSRLHWSAIGTEGCTTAGCDDELRAVSCARTLPRSPDPTNVSGLRWMGLRFSATPGLYSGV